MEEKTTRQRVSSLEDRMDSMMEILVNNNTNITNELVKIGDNVKQTNERVDKMYPIVRDIIYVKGYGSFTWKILKWIGLTTLACITSWHLFKDHVKHFFHYIFN